MGPGLLVGSRGLVAAPVRVADADSVALVRSGDVINVYAAAGDAVLGTATLGDASLAGGGTSGSSGRARLVADRARVLAVPRSDTQAATADGALLLLAVTPETARSLAGAASAERLSLVITSADDTGGLVR